MGLIQRIKDMKLPCEANIVACIYKNTEALYEYSNLNIDDFHSDIWKFYFNIAKTIVIQEKKPVLDRETIGFFIMKNPEMEKQYKLTGGFESINATTKYINLANLEGYILELNKLNSMLKLAENVFRINEHFDTLKDMSSDDIYNFYTAKLNDVFINNETSIKSHNLCEGLHALIDDCDKGADIGLPLRAPLLNDLVGGNILGNVTLLGASSGTGKTTITLQILLSSIIEQNEQCIMVINEQDEKKLRKEMLTWVVNNEMGYKFNKKRLRQGQFSDEEKKWLHEAADWLEAKKDNRNITIIPLSTYNVGIMQKIICKYASLGVKYFILDTFKAGDTPSQKQTWEEMMHDMRKLYDTVKPANKNVHLWCTLQLKKDKAGSRYLTQDNIGMSKNVTDVCSTVILMRHVRDDEKQEGKKELKVYRLEGSRNKSKIPVILDPNKTYIVLFIDKNREGESHMFQIVVEVNLARNIYQEIGITNVPEDY
jgi:replicative DNA helicase